MLPDPMPPGRLQPIMSADNDGAGFDRAGFAAGLLDPAQPTPSMVCGARGKAAHRRYDVYRNNVTVSLIEAMASIYPAVQRICGNDFFRAMARGFIRQAPPTSPLLFDYGRGFPAFIAAFAEAETMPWLADVACIERAWLDAYHAADAAPLRPEALAEVGPDELGDLVFTPHPATRIVGSHYAAVTIFAANRSAEPFATIDAGVPEDALVCRPDFDVIVHRLAPAEMTFATALIKGCSLGAAAAMSEQRHVGFDLAAGIVMLLGAGAFTAAAASPDGCNGEGGS